MCKHLQIQMQCKDFTNSNVFFGSKYTADTQIHKGNSVAENMHLHKNTNGSKYTDTQIHKYFTNPKVNQWQQSRRSTPEQRPPSRGADLVEQPRKIISNSQLRCRDFVLNMYLDLHLFVWLRLFMAHLPLFFNDFGTPLMSGKK